MKMNFPDLNYGLLTLVFFATAVLMLLLTVILSIVWDLGRLVSDVSGRTAKREISKLENRNRANSDGILDTNSDLYSELTSRNLQMPTPEAQGLPSASARAFGGPERAVGAPERAMGAPERMAGATERALGNPQRALGAPEGPVGAPERAMGAPERALGDPGIDFGEPNSDPYIPSEGYVEPARSVLEDDQGTNILEDGYADSSVDLVQEESYDTNMLASSGTEDSYDTNMLDGTGSEGVQEDSYDTNMLDESGTEDSYDTNMLDGSDVDDFVRVDPESPSNVEDSYDTNMLDQEDTEESYDTNILNQEEPNESYTKPRLVLEISSY